LRVVVTGSKGFLGTYVVEDLQNNEYHVIEYDLQDGNDIFDVKKLEEALSTADACIHLAAVADLYEAERNHSHCYNVNVLGAELVGKVCADLNVKLIFTSTVCAYGNNGFELQTEQSPLIPTEIYAETKAIAEEKLLQIRDLDVKIVRPATFYGPKMRPSLAISRFITAISEDAPIQVHGSGEQTRCYTHVNDVAKGITCVLREWPNDDVFNIAVQHPLSVLELIKNIQSIIGKTTEVVFVNDREGQISSSIISSIKIKKLGWMPEYDIIKGLMHTIHGD
jgi:nucleoside-diphosphate-sugar epimerase